MLCLSYLFLILAFVMKHSWQMTNKKITMSKASWQSTSNYQHAHLSNCPEWLEQKLLWLFSFLLTQVKYKSWPLCTERETRRPLPVSGKAPAPPSETKHTTTPISMALHTPRPQPPHSRPQSQWAEHPPLSSLSKCTHSRTNLLLPVILLSGKLQKTRPRSPWHIGPLWDLTIGP